MFMFIKKKYWEKETEQRHACGNDTTKGRNSKSKDERDETEQ